MDGGIDPGAVGGGGEREREAAIVQPAEQVGGAGQEFGVFLVGTDDFAAVAGGVFGVGAGEAVAGAEVFPGVLERGAEVALVVGHAEIDAFVGEHAAGDLEVERLAVDEDSVHVEDHRLGRAVRERGHGYALSASTPPVMSSSSEVICSWRALL